MPRFLLVFILALKKWNWIFWVWRTVSECWHSNEGQGWVVDLPALSFSSYHWFSAGTWQRTWIHKFSVASERTTQQLWSSRISITRQLMLPAIDVINNSWGLYYPALYSCINQGYIACFLSYFSSWMLQRGASLLNGIYGLFLWICLLLKYNVFSQWWEDTAAFFVTARGKSHPPWAMVEGGWVCPCLLSHINFERIMLLSPFSSHLMLKISEGAFPWGTEALLWGLWAVPWMPGLQQQSFFIAHLKSVPEVEIRVDCSFL